MKEEQFSGDPSTDYLPLIICKQNIGKSENKKVEKRD